MLHDGLSDPLFLRRIASSQMKMMKCHIAFKISDAFVLSTRLPGVEELALPDLEPWRSGSSNENVHG